MLKKYFKLQTLQIFTALLFTLLFVFYTSFQVPKVLAGERIASSKDTRTKETSVVIIRSQEIMAYNDVIKGFEEGCKGRNIFINAIYDLKGYAEEGKRIIRSIQENPYKPDLILAVGVLAATIVKEQFTDLPIVFCMVINHERFNLQGDNTTGISSEASVEDQFALVKELLGSYKNVGVIYDPTKTEKIILEATRVAKKYEFNLIKEKVLSSKDVASALKNIADKINALWIIPDGTVITKDSLDSIIKATLKNHLPTFCTSSAIVKAGALVSISPDYTYTGLQAAEIAQTLLSDSKTTSLGIQQPNRLKLTINTQTAEIIGINLSAFKSRPGVVFFPNGEKNL